MLTEAITLLLNNSWDEILKFNLFLMVYGNIKKLEKLLNWIWVLKYGVIMYWKEHKFK